MTDFDNKVLSIVSQIPRGKVITYLQVAEKLGNKGLARAVGNALHRNPYLIKIPCHRVVRSDHKVGNYALGLAKKIKVLQNEGIIIKQGKVADFPSCLYRFN